MKWIKLNRSKIKVFGKPAKVLMKGMTAPEEHTHFNLWLRQNGHPVGDFFVYKVENYYILDTEKPAQEVIEEFERLKLSLKVYFEDLTPQMAHFFVFGEGVSEFVKDAFGVDIKEGEIEESEGVFIARNHVRLKGEGYDLMGEPKAIIDKLPTEEEVSEQEFEDLRIERCVPKIGKELKEGFSPLEAGVLNYAIDMNKGCYVGQEAIARVYFKGRTPRVLVRMEKVEGSVEEGDKLTEGQKAVGVITSLNSKGELALGYVLRNSYEPGREVSASSGKVRLGDSCEQMGKNDRDS